MNTYKTNLKTYKFTDGDFSMNINVSLEEHNVYLNQKEIIELLDISQPTASRLLSQIRKNQMGQVATYIQKMNITGDKYSYYYSLEIIKEIGRKYNPERIEKLENWLYDILPLDDHEIIDNNYEIVRYNQDNISVPVRLDKETNTVWLTQKQIAEIFETTKQNISLHIINIFEDEELDKNSVVKDYLTTAEDGKTYKITIYNIDLILAVGYRVRTSRTIQFRRWVSKIVEKHLLSNSSSRNLVNLNGYFMKKFDLIDVKFENIKTEIGELKPKNIIFYKEQAFDAYIFLSVFIATAKSEVFIIDPYADRFTMSLLKIVKDNINIVIVLSKYGQIDEEQIDLFKRINPNTSIKLIRNDDEHDRHIFVDRKYGYILGSSINSFSYHDFSVIKVDDVNYIKNKINHYI